MLFKGIGVSEFKKSWQLVALLLLTLIGGLSVPRDALAVVIQGREPNDEKERAMTTGRICLAQVAPPAKNLAAAQKGMEEVEKEQEVRKAERSRGKQQETKGVEESVERAGIEVVVKLPLEVHADKPALVDVTVTEIGRPASGTIRVSVAEGAIGGYRWKDEKGIWPWGNKGPGRELEIPLKGGAVSFHLIGPWKTRFEATDVSTVISFGGTDVRRSYRFTPFDAQAKLPKAFTLRVKAGLYLGDVDAKQEWTYTFSNGAVEGRQAHRVQGEKAWGTRWSDENERRFSGSLAGNEVTGTLEGRSVHTMRDRGHDHTIRTTETVKGRFWLRFVGERQFLWQTDYAEESVRQVVYDNGKVDEIERNTRRVRELTDANEPYVEAYEITVAPAQRTVRLEPPADKMLRAAPSLADATRQIAGKDAALIVRDENGNFYAISNKGTKMPLPEKLRDTFDVSNEFAILGNDALLDNSTSVKQWIGVRAVASSEHSSVRGTINGGGDFVYLQKIPTDLKDHDYIAFEQQKMKILSPASSVVVESRGLVASSEHSSIHGTINGGGDFVYSDQPASIMTPAAEIRMTATRVAVDVGFNGVTGVLVLDGRVVVREPVTGSQLEVGAGEATVVVPGFPVGNRIRVADAQINRWWDKPVAQAKPTMPSVPTPSRPPVAPPPAPIPASRIYDVTTARNVAWGKPVGPSAVFSPDVNPIYVWFRHQGLAAGTTITSVWYFTGTATPTKIGGGSVAVTPESDWGQFNFELARGKRWPVGDYRVEMLVSGAPVGEAKFQVATSPPTSVVATPPPTSGGIGGLASETSQPVGMERDTTRWGSDYGHIVLPRDDPGLCRDACNNDPKCKAWTYVKPNVQGPGAHCWLTSAVPQPKPNTCCVSGVKTSTEPTTPTPVGVNLTGTWNCDSGGKFYIRQVGNNVWWYGEGAPTSPAWSNVAHGVLVGNELRLEWADVPKGRNMFSGSLVLKVESNSRMVAISKTGGFGTSVWTK